MLLKHVRLDQARLRLTIGTQQPAVCRSYYTLGTTQYARRRRWCAGSSMFIGRDYGKSQWNVRLKLCGIVDVPHCMLLALTMASPVSCVVIDGTLCIQREPCPRLPGLPCYCLFSGALTIGCNCASSNHNVPRKRLTTEIRTGQSIAFSMSYLKLLVRGAEPHFS
jgi:hypothetical protein